MRSSLLMTFEGVPQLCFYQILCVYVSVQYRYVCMAASSMETSGS